MRARLARPALVPLALAAAALAQTGSSSHTPASPPRPTRSPTAHALAERLETVTVTVVETITPVANATQTTAADATSLPSLTVASTVPVAATMGLIMPAPWTEIYTGLQYTLGWVDPGPRPAPIVGGWLRHVVPLLLLSNYTIDVFPSAGTADPTSNASLPRTGDTLCGSLAQFNDAYMYTFNFTTPGYHMFIVNETWTKPTITNDTCALPLVSERSFFATQIFSVRPYPTTGNQPVGPTTANTVWADVTTSTPGSLPVTPAPTTDPQKLAVGLGVAAGIASLIGIVVTMLLVRKKKRRRAEAFAFYRLKPDEQAAFLAENPDSWLSPARGPTSRGARTTAALREAAATPSGGRGTATGAAGTGTGRRRVRSRATQRRRRR